MNNTLVMNNRGQFVIEGILLMVVFMGILAAVTTYFDKNDVLGSLVRGPWTNLSGMIQNGEWMTPDKGAIYHPSQHARHVTIDGVNPSAGGSGLP